MLGQRRHYHGEIPEFRRRYRYLVVAIVMIFCVLLGRLWQLQGIRGRTYRRVTEDNFVQQLRIPTVRGRIFDRAGQLLATNRPSYDVYVTPHFVDRRTISRLVQLLALDTEASAALRRRIAHAAGRGRFVSRVLLRDISRDQLARLETARNVLRGVSIVAVAHREYPQGRRAAHLIGYMNEVDSAQLRSDRGRHYLPGDLVGRFGVERLLERHLRGTPGWERVVVDARGRRKSSRVGDVLLAGRQRRVAPLSGHDVVLTIDTQLQKAAEDALRWHNSAAAVVLQVRSGRILASVSHPRFSPNTLTGRLSAEEAKALMTDPRRPLLDKTYREHYFPGSTYKVVTAIAALEEGLVTPSEKVTCKRWYHFGGRNFRCAHSHGDVDLHQAIAESCNVYFYTIAERVGMDRIAHYARLLGLGATTGVGLNGEVSGFIPTKSWYERRKIAFRLGYTLNAAIGQGNTKVTPIQIANLYATIANGGQLLLPQVVERVVTREGMLVHGFKRRVRRSVPLKPETVSLIRRALADVVQHRKGTAYEARIPQLQVAGKTGTAQVGARLGKDGKRQWLPDHAWFAAYAPVRDPEVAVSVLIEHGGQAAKAAAPVAMRILRDYFQIKHEGAPVSADRKTPGSLVRVAAHGGAP